MYRLGGQVLEGHCLKDCASIRPETAVATGHIGRARFADGLYGLITQGDRGGEERAAREPGMYEHIATDGTQTLPKAPTMPVMPERQTMP
jgi:hypothetical protein